MDIETLIVDLSKDPFNPLLNFDVAVRYQTDNQTASAVSFYLRTIEYGYQTHPLHVYTSLLRLAHCFEDQKDRALTVSNALLQAIAYLPNRPEGYFLLSRFHERNATWQEAYTFAKVGLQYDDGRGYHDIPDHDYFPSLPVNIDYLGRFCLEFEVAVSAYWVGRKAESIELFRKLYDLDLPANYRASVLENLEKLNVTI